MWCIEMCKVKEINLNKIIFGAIFVLLLLVPWLHISARNLPYIYNDEFGYWASAAHFVGFDWSEIFSKIPYYSYGYGIILAILIKITGDMAEAYKVAVALNGLWLALSYVILYKAGTKIYPDVKKVVMLLAAAVAVAFSGNFVQVNYTWPETFLFFLFCLLFYLIVMLAEYPSFLKLIILAILSAYMFCVHQRTLGIIIAVVLFIFLLILKKQIEFKQLIYFVLPFVVCIVAIVIYKMDIIEKIWMNGSVVEGNNFTGQVGKFALIFSLEGIRDLLLSFLGKLYYIFLSTFLLVPFSIYIIFTKWWFPKNKEQREISKIFVGLFLILSFIFTMGINSLGMIRPGNITHIVYGRYTDNILGPFMLIAILEFVEHKVTVKNNVMDVLIYGGLNFAVYYALRLYHLHIQAAINNAGIAYVVENDDIELVKGFVVGIGVWLFLQLLNRIIKKREIAVASISIFMIVLFWAVGQKTYKKFELDWRDAASSSEKHAQIIEDMCKMNETLEIYAVNGGPANFPWLFAGNGIQFLLGDKIVHSVILEDAMEMSWPDDVIVLAPCVLVEADGLSEVSGDTVYRLFVSNNIVKQTIQ